MQIHPTFYTDTQLWEYETYTAPTICQLKKLLPKGCKVEGYVPDGHQTPKMEGPPPSFFRPTLNNFKQPKQKTREDTNRASKKSIEEKQFNYVLDLWAEGKSNKEIQKQLGISETKVKNIIELGCWNANDPSSMRRVGVRVNERKWNKEDFELLRAHLEALPPTPRSELRKMFNLTRGALNGRIARMYQGKYDKL